MLVVVGVADGAHQHHRREEREGVRQRPAGKGEAMEYVLMTAHEISGSIAHSLGGSITHIMNGVTGQMQPLAPDVRTLFDSMLNNPIGTALGVGLLVLLVGLLFARRG